MGKQAVITRLINNYHQLIIQVFRFGIVGFSAAAVNFLGVILLVEFFSLQPLIANIFAYLCAFGVSFIGHKHWTFSTQNAPAPLAKFFLVSGLSFLANEGLFLILLSYLHLNYSVALIFVLIIVPPFTFISSKFWAFRQCTSKPSVSSLL